MDPNPFISSFFPAGLSLVIELMFTKAGRPQWDVKQIIKSLPTDEVQNPVVYRLETRDDSMTRTLDTHLLHRFFPNILSTLSWFSSVFAGCE